MLAKNTLAILIKHNLVKAWQSELDLITYYKLDEQECLLRLSLPKYLSRISHTLTPIHSQILEAIVIYGSLLKSEIAAVLDSPININSAIDDLIQMNYVLGAHSYLVM